MTIVRAAITQTTWTGDKESMLDKHEQFARDAKEQGAQVICFQELFYGPYFGITEDVKYYDYAEPADGPIVQRFAALAKELGMVMVLPIYEEEQPGVYYNTAVVVDADGTILGSYRKHHIPQPRQVLGEVLLPPRQPRLPGVPHGRRARSARTSATTGTSPRAGASSASTARRSSSTRTPRSRASRTASGRSSSRPPPPRTATSSPPPTASASRTTSTATSP